MLDAHVDPDPYNPASLFEVKCQAGPAWVILSPLLFVFSLYNRFAAIIFTSISYGYFALLEVSELLAHSSDPLSLTPFARIHAVIEKPGVSFVCRLCAVFNNLGCFCSTPYEMGASPICQPAR